MHWESLTGFAINTHVLGNIRAECQAILYRPQNVDVFTRKQFEHSICHTITTLFVLMDQCFYLKNNTNVAITLPPPPFRTLFGL